MPTVASDALTRKLCATTGLSPDDIAAIEALPINVRTLPAHHVIVHDGERPQDCCIVIEGFAFRSKMTRAGKRQILSVHVPGDIPDLQSLFLEKMDHDFATLTPATVGVDFGSNQGWLLHTEAYNNFHVSSTFAGQRPEDVDFLNAIGLHGGEDLVERGNETRREAVQRLVRGHDREIMIRLDGEKLEHLVEHLLMLARDAHHGVDFRIGLHLLDERRHFYGFRPRAENRQYFR